MYSRFITGANVICALAVIVIFTSCAGGKTSPVAHFTDPNDPPGIVDNNVNGGGGGSGSPIDNGGSGGGGTSGPAPQPIQGALPSAPLGTNPKYQVHEIAPFIFGGSSTSSLKSGSVFAGPEFALISMTAYNAAYTNPSFDPGTLNWDMTNGDGNSQPFEYMEGTKVILWVATALYSPSGIPTTFNVPELWFNEEHILSLQPDVANNFVYLGLPLTLPFLADDEARPCHFKLWATAEDGSRDYAYRFGLQSDLSGQKPDNDRADGIPFNVTNNPDIIPVNVAPMWILAWETNISNNPNATYDYNNVVMSMYGRRFEGPKNEDGSFTLYGFDIVYKPVARGDGNSGQWQFDIENDFDSQYVQSIVHELQFNTTTADGLHPDGVYAGSKTRRYASSNGVDSPVFTPNTPDLLPSPPGGGSTANTDPYYNDGSGVIGDMWSTGGCAWVQINFGSEAGIIVNPGDPGYDEGYIPLPCSQTMYVEDPLSDNNVLVIRIETPQGGTNNGNITKDSYNRPLGFILRDLPYDWIMDPAQPGDTPINDAYEQFNSWVDWLNNPSGTEPKWWEHSDAPYAPFMHAKDDMKVPHDSASENGRINRLKHNPMYSYQTPPTLGNAYYFDWNWLAGFSPD